MSHNAKPDPYELLNRAVDRSSFMEFLRALVEERNRVEEEGRKEPAPVTWGAPRGWQNHDISAFLTAAAFAFEDGRYEGSDAHPSWRDLAVFLWFGKIYE